MSTDKKLTIHVEYTGNEPNMKPAASAVARTIRAAVTADGTFADAALEAEYLEWTKAKSADAATPTDQKGLAI